jgi:hypothetical protein
MRIEMLLTTLANVILVILMFIRITDVGSLLLVDLFIVLFYFGFRMALEYSVED